MRRFFLALAARLTLILPVLAAPAFAQCSGANLFDEMTPDRQAEIRAMAAAHPYPDGNFWIASRGDQRMTILGTYHFDDPRHAPALEAAAPLIADASALLVEAGPEEEKALMKAMGDDPSLMFITTGPTLLEMLPADTWKRLSQALEARGIPGLFAAKFQPWYATMVLAIPPCAMAAATAQQPKGLDGMLIDTALALEVPVRALEPHDTIFQIFGSLSAQQEIDMIESSLVMESRSEDFSATLADLYFNGESRLIWEMMRVISYDMPGYTPEAVDAEMAVMEDVLMEKRNRAWIPVIEQAALEGPLVVAFGALHLSGDAGVLNLLEQQGWALEPVAF